MQRSGWTAAQDAHADEEGEIPEQPLFEVLAQLGVEEKPARVVAYLARHGNGRSAELEEACGLRQPEVSKATMELRNRGWVVAEREKKPGKGRPVNNYHLKVSLHDIAAEIEAAKREEINQELARIERLKTLLEHAPEDPPEPSARSR